MPETHVCSLVFEMDSWASHRNYQPADLRQGLIICTWDQHPLGALMPMKQAGRGTECSIPIPQSMAQVHSSIAKAWESEWVLILDLYSRKVVYRYTIYNTNFSSGIQGNTW